MALREPHLILRDGTPVLIRRLVAEDAALYPDFLSEVSAEDLRLRFFASMREVSHELLDKLINYDPARAMAFIAVDEKSEKMLGVVRLHDDASGKDAEFAIGHGGRAGLSHCRRSELSWRQDGDTASDFLSRRCERKAAHAR